MHATMLLMKIGIYQALSNDYVLFARCFINLITTIVWLHTHAFNYYPRVVLRDVSHSHKCHGRESCAFSAVCRSRRGLGCSDETRIPRWV